MKKFVSAILLSIVVLGLTNQVMAKDFVVVLDAGHGGHDPGALGSYGKEKNINLNVTLKLGRLIEQNCKDTRVVYTRKSDVFVPLHDRADIANDAKADLFISIHTNSLPKRTTRVSGTETYTLGLHRTQDNLEVAKKENSVILIEKDYKQRYAGFNPNSSESYIIFEFMQDKNMSQSVEFARNVQRQFRNGNRIDKGVHQAGFLVLRETSMPSVLIELGYISNPNEETFLISDSGTTTLARCIYNAFIKYKQSQNHTSTSERPININDNDQDIKADTSSERPEINDPMDQTDNQPKRNIDNLPSVTDNPAKTVTDKPIFKIQILTATRELKPGDSRLKGLTGIEYYKEGNILKYTYGNDENYNKIRRIKSEVIDKRFKGAFIIAFMNGEKIDVNEAIKLFLKKK